MNSLAKMAIVATLLPVASSANADFLGGTVGTSLWYADSSISQSGIQKDTGKGFATGVYASLEHPIPLLPNALIRFDRFNKNDARLTATDFILYYELLSFDIASLDVGASLSNYDGKVFNQSYNDWTLNGYLKAEVGIPLTDVSIYGQALYNNWDSDIRDLQAGIKWNLASLLPIDLNLKTGYRIIDNNYKGFDNFTGNYKQKGFYAGVELDF